MTDNERSTHFQGFAELVAQELREQDLLFIGNHIKPLVEPPIDVDYEIIKRIIAQRAYDLVEHTLLSLDIDTTRALISHVPDLKIPPTE